MFRAIFVHLQDRKTEIFTAYGSVLCEDDRDVVAGNDQ